MRRGLERGSHAGEVGAPTCPLILCLLSCLFDAQACSSRSAAFLCSALADLGHRVEPYDCLPLGGGPHPRALAACLGYILPEVSMRSEAAGDKVRRAIDALCDEGPAYTTGRHGKSVSRH